MAGLHQSPSITSSNVCIMDLRRIIQMLLSTCVIELVTRVAEEVGLPLVRVASTIILMRILDVFIVRRVCHRCLRLVTHETLMIGGGIMKHVVVVDRIVTIIIIILEEDLIHVTHCLSCPNLRIITKTIINVTIIITAATLVVGMSIKRGGITTIPDPSERSTIGPLAISMQGLREDVIMMIIIIVVTTRTMIRIQIMNLEDTGEIISIELCTNVGVK